MLGAKLIMPTVKINAGPYRFFFYSAEGIEPPHIHVERDELEAKFWLDPVELEYNHGFSQRELNKIYKLVVIHKEKCLTKWREHFED